VLEEREEEKEGFFVGAKTGEDRPIPGTCRIGPKSLSLKEVRGDAPDCVCMS
jgi:hypothetical protein